MQNKQEFVVLFKTERLINSIRRFTFKNSVVFSEKAAIDRLYRRWPVQGEQASGVPPLLQFGSGESSGDVGEGRQEMKWNCHVVKGTPSPSRAPRLSYTGRRLNKRLS